MSTFLRFFFAALMFDGSMRSALLRAFQNTLKCFLPYRLGIMPGHKQSGRSVKPLSNYAERLQNIAVHPGNVVDDSKFLASIQARMLIVRKLFCSIVCL
jgi:hypothetical protein